MATYVPARTPSFVPGHAPAIATTQGTIHQVGTALNSPDLHDISLHGWGSAYKRKLEAAGFPSNTSRDFTGFVESVQLTESAGEAAMQMDVQLSDPGIPGKPSVLTPLTVGTHVHLYGYRLDYFLGGNRSPKKERIFRGQVYEADKDVDGPTRTRSLSVYDAATFLARTEAILVYNGATMTQIVQDVAKKYGFKLGVVVDTKVKVGKIIMGPGWTLWRLIQEAARRTYNLTGRSYYVRSRPNVSRSLDLLNFGDWQGEGTGITWRITDGYQGSMLSHSLRDSAQDLATRFLITQEKYDDEGEFKNTNIMRQGIVIGELREVFGDLVKIMSPDSSLSDVANPDDPEWNQAEQVMGVQMRQAMANYGRTKKTATVRSLYIPGLRRGDRISTGVQGDVLDKQTGWIVDSVSTSWGASGAGQTIELVKYQADSSVGVG